MPKQLNINIELHQDKLRLRWSDGVTRRVLSLGVPDTPDGRALAYKLKDQIANEFSLGVYDASLLRYKAALTNTKTQVTCPQLWDLFTRHQTRTKKLNPSSIKSRYLPIGVSLTKYLDQSAKYLTPTQINHFKTQALDTLNPNTAKARVWLLQACWTWAQGKYSIQEPNPWTALTDQFKPIPTKPPEPFSLEEVQQILEGFRTSRYYAHYYDFVYFLFGVGCRFGEAVALTWSNLNQDMTSVWIGQSQTDKQLNPTKTRRARAVNLSPSVTAMLRARRAQIEAWSWVEPWDPQSLIFQTPEGHPINDRNFRRRAWTKTLAHLGIPYRKPYTTRATAISHALANGANYIAVAKAAGHDPQVMHSHYANVINPESVFIDFTPSPNQDC